MRFIPLMIFTGLLMQSCCTANTQVLPHGSKRATVISSSSEENCAYKEAKEKASKYCSRTGRRAVFIKDKSEYRGMNRDTRGVIEGAGAIMGKSIYLGSSDDYKVRLKIKCVR
ncbi:hypothetical protein N9D31_04180 [Oligoflexaceae bacterium]|nr:hypothetical protein [Oligoflexaceae bacterium]